MKNARKPYSIAITGIGGIFPGSDSLEEFWKMISDGKSASERVPDGRWPEKCENYLGTNYAPDKVGTVNCCAIKKLPENYSHINLDPKFIETLDPLYKLVLQAGRDAFLDSKTDNLDLSRVPVIIANIALPTDSTSQITRDLNMEIIKSQLNGEQLNKENLLKINPYNRFSAEFPAGLLAAGLGLGGGCYTLDAACASSLYAIKLACDELTSGKADAVLTGGASRPSSQFTQMGFTQLHAISKSGVCRPFDKDGDGLIVGEGAGLFMLKRLDDAIASGDKIYGVIRGIGLANDVGGSLLAPYTEGQLRAMRSAYAQAGWKPTDVQLIECHGTGTPTGDAVELRSIKELIGNDYPKNYECVIGSVKSNVGHLLTGAGAAGLMKVLFALNYKELPSVANFRSADPALELDKTPIRILTQSRFWESPSENEPRRCAVSAFGFGGIDAHVLIEEFIPKEDKESGHPTLRRGRSSNNTASSFSKAISETTSPNEPDIAIVALDVRIGSLQNSEECFKAFANGKPAKSKLPENRHQANINEDWVNEGAYIDKLEIRPGEFKISPIELQEVLPQQLLMLQTVSGAIKNLTSKVPQSKLDWGTFIGISQDFEASNFACRWAINSDLSTYGIKDTEPQKLCDEITPPLNHPRTVGSLGGIVASRIAREYSIGGPSHTFSSAENSGISALETAVDALKYGEINTAVVGAVDMAGDLRNILAVDKVKKYSRKGGSTAFDKSADGTFPGEGAVSLILKRKEDAIKDGDRIIAIIKGFGKASSEKLNDRKSNIEACKRAMSNAYNNANIQPNSISLFATGSDNTSEENFIEAASLAEFMPKVNNEDAFKADDQLCALSNCKMIFGQTGAAAGLISVAQMAMCLNKQILPRFQTLKAPIEPLAEIKDAFFAPNVAQYWFRNRANGPRRAAVNTIGIDGSFCHTILEGFENSEQLSEEAQTAEKINFIYPTGEPEDCVFLIGGTSTCDLKERISALKNLEASSIKELALEYWQQFPLREKATVFAGIVASSIEELRQRIDVAVNHIYNQPDKPITAGPDINDKIFYTPTPQALQGKIVFAFPGSGNHFLGMGSELAASFPKYLRDLDKQYELLAAQFAPRKIAPWRLSYEDKWEEQAMKELLDDHNSLVFSHVSCCSLISDIVRGFGIEPDIIMGYSLGETAGNFSTRTWRERDEMVRRMRASNLFTTELIGKYNSPRRYWGLDENAKIDWVLGMLTCPAAEVEKYINDFDQVYILIENTPDECVIGGNKHQVDIIVKLINKPFFSLEGVSSVHCPAAIPASDAYRKLHLYDCFPPAQMTFISSGKGEVFVPEKEACGDSILAQCIGRINFPKCVETAYNEGGRVFLEIGPKSSMSRMVNNILGNRPHFARSAMTGNQSENTSLLKFLANCAAEGVKVNLDSIYGKKQNIEKITINVKPIAVPVGKKLTIQKSAIKESAKPTEKPVEKTVEKPLISTQKPVVQKATIQKTESKTLKAEPLEIPSKPIVAKPSSTPIKQKISSAYNATINQNKVVYQPKQITANPKPMKSNIANSIVSSWNAAQQSTSAAHDAYLNLSADITNSIAQLIAGKVAMPVISADMQKTSTNKQTPIQVSTQKAKKYPKPYNGPVFLNWEGSMEFAVGKIGKALGEYFAPIDAHPTRVRLPDIPLNFVDRIISVEGEKGSLGKGKVITEHDVYPDAWYLDNDCMPTGLSVEAGQADLFLSGWLGIDFKTKGIAKYRLLDAVVTFHGPLPRPGDTIHYDIRVDRFIRQADTYLFFFEYDGSIDGKHLITMRKGCAGFFTDKQLADGKGIVLTEADTKPEPKPNLPGRENLPEMTVQSFDDNALELLRQSKFEEAFGKDFAGLQFNAQTIPSGKMKMIDRITEIDPKGGRFGLGRIKAEIDIPQNAWFLTQHFCDDQVMPGTLMYESCMQSLRVFLLRMGWIAPAEKCAFEPIIGVQSQLRCRGQVIPGVKKALYDIEIKELGYGPEPYAIADALMFADGNRIVQVLNMSIRLSGTNREEIEALWKSRKVSNPISSNNKIDPEILPAIYTAQQIYEYAKGKPSLCFGDAFKPYDNDKFLARLPNPPYLFVDRITAVNAEFLKIKTGGTVQGQFDIKPDHWYFKANRQTSIPFSVLLEFPLQVCGWYSCFMGSANTSDKPLHYRNLDGSAVLYEDINVNSGTLTATVKSTKAANAGGMLIQSFDMVVTKGDRKIYEGNTTFGFFTEEALANQIGLRGIKRYQPTEAEIERNKPFNLEKVAPFTPQDDTIPQMNGLALPGKCYLMIDKIELFVPDGGPKGLGYIRGLKEVDKTEWFFKAHFYQDPVIPGSLGLESYIQLLKVVAINRWGKELEGKPCHYEPMALGQKHTWSYRGQVIPPDKLVTVDACVTSIDDATHTIIADGFLSVDGRVIYSMKDFALRVALD